MWEVGDNPKRALEFKAFKVERLPKISQKYKAFNNL